MSSKWSHSHSHCIGWYFAHRSQQSKNGTFCWVDKDLHGASSRWIHLTVEACRTVEWHWYWEGHGRRIWCDLCFEIRLHHIRWGLCRFGNSPLVTKQSPGKSRWIRRIRTDFVFPSFDLLSTGCGSNALIDSQPDEIRWGNRRRFWGVVILTWRTTQYVWARRCDLHLKSQIRFQILFSIIKIQISRMIYRHLVHLKENEKSRTLRIGCSVAIAVNQHLRTWDDMDCSVCQRLPEITMTVRHSIVMLLRRIGVHFFVIWLRQ